MSEYPAIVLVLIAFSVLYTGLSIYNAMPPNSNRGLAVIFGSWAVLSTILSITYHTDWRLLGIH